MIVANKETYILSMIDHKSTYELTPDISIEVDKSFENNLRERNPQLGKVEAMPDENPLQLAIGDIVAVNHFVFYGDVGKERAFTLQDHTVLDGVKLFRVYLRQIFFKYNYKKTEPVGDFTLVEKITTPIEKFGVYFGEETKIMNNGVEVLTLPNALYSITLDKVEYFKIRKDEIVATIVDGIVTPVDGCLIVEYFKEPEPKFFGIKRDNNLRAKIISSRLMGFNPGDEIQVYRNQGVEYDGKRIIDSEMILGRCIDKIAV